MQFSRRDIVLPLPPARIPVALRSKPYCLFSYRSHIAHCNWTASTALLLCISSTATTVAMDRPSTPNSNAPPRYGGPPSYFAVDEEDTSPTHQDWTPSHQTQNGSTMRLLTHVEESGYRPLVAPDFSVQAHASSLSSLSSSLQNNVAEVGDIMDSLRAKGKQVATEAAIVDLLRAETSLHSHSSKNFLKNTKRKTVKACLKARLSPKEQKSSGDLLNTSSRPTPLTRSYHPSTNSLPLSRASSIIHSAPEIPPPQTEGSPYMPYRAASPGRTSPSRSWTPSRASTDWPRPPASTVSYEPADINGSPRPGTPSSRYGGSPKRPLPPAPLFAAGRPVSRDSNKTSVEASTISIDDDDVFGNPSEEPRPDFLPRDSFASQSTYTEEHTTTDEKTEHYGPAPEGAQARRGARQAQMAKKEVRLINGELILECKIPTILNSFLPRKDDIEFTHMRYTAVTCDPDDFVSRGYKLRQNIGSTARETELFICITMYNENEIDFTRTMHGVMRNITHFCSRTKSRTWGKDGWQKIVVCIISDGRQKVHPRTLDALAAMGCYQDGIAKNLVNQREVTAHVYEYTTQVSLDSDLKFKGAEKGIVPCQMIFCLKEKNQKKLNSHRWFFNAFGRALNPNVCILLDVGTKPGSKALYYLWKAFDTDSNVAGAAGEIKAGKGKGWLGLLNPLVASQNFEYKMSNILDKPLESVFGYITVLPGALSAYRYHALQNDSTGHGPLSQYFKGETLHGQDADVFTANMYLAEDRILCWELVAKRNERWVLKYVKSATGETDVPGKRTPSIFPRI